MATNAIEVSYHPANRKKTMKCVKTSLLILLFLIVSLSVFAGDYVDNGNDTITDRKTGLTWQKKESRKMRWKQAVDYCLGLNLAGKSNWRLPSKRELLTLVERSMFNPSINRQFFPDAVPENYWSSSTGTIATGSAAWLVNFGFGEMHYFNKANEYLVRCVADD